MHNITIEAIANAARDNDRETLVKIGDHISQYDTYDDTKAGLKLIMAILNCMDRHERNERTVTVTEWHELVTTDKVDPNASYIITGT